MTHKFYRNFLISFYFIFTPLFFINFLSNNVNWIKINKTMSLMLYYIVPILSLLLLYFSLYAYVNKVKYSKNMGSPRASIIGSSIIIIISFGFPIVGFLNSYYLQSEPIRITQIESVIENGIIPEGENGESLAELYFLQTGEAIEYIDRQGNKVIYSPSESVKKYNQTQQYIERQFNIKKKNIIILLSITMLSVIIFILFLQYTKGH